MRTYTLHLPEHTLAGETQEIDRAQVVPDGFSWPAFAYGPLWFLYHRLWVAALLVTVLLVGAVVLGQILNLRPVAGAAVALLMQLLIGLEASSLRRWTYARQGRPVRDAVVAGSAEEAEIKVVGRWLDPARAARPPAAPFPSASSRVSEGVIGLFPFSEDRR
ncbi:DUF2628 domain-containing protein [Methylobacterium sp. Leaf108]|uniref:DUF2628 domain-containing protein n=1 Tax=Methylobacterium sp. Leaf108 TaxID=1736256 RepID=UPI0006FD9F27|nr:DUF2628 domain-containing protein [Methylobacterium sp. Leaf108]KQP61451.1 hypothetical protein ASF39_01840 [Methylobacterium sp. Leaf108]